METWKQYDANALTHSAAHHLLAIHELGAQYGGWARVSDIARFLGITRGSVSISLRSLKTRGWIDTDAHRMVRLSPHGLEVVDNISAKRTAVEMFFREVLGLSPEQAEIDSCKIEHLISPETAERLVNFMRFLTDKRSGARDMLRAFRHFQEDCAGKQNCEVCRNRCLLAQLGNPKIAPKKEKVS
ncbi:MAG TPA: metal-dependent transcriptional regulator, partial [Candidatus Paceibacterota bacterium]|nr:metal-dependent transcriptional regulator [Candidatus Paceibacterota bacterium]